MLDENDCNFLKTIIGVIYRLRASSLGIPLDINLYVCFEIFNPKFCKEWFMYLEMFKVLFFFSSMILFIKVCIM